MATEAVGQAAIHSPPSILGPKEPGQAAPRQGSGRITGRGGNLDLGDQQRSCSPRAGRRGKAEARRLKGRQAGRPDVTAQQPCVSEHGLRALSNDAI